MFRRLHRSVLLLLHACMATTITPYSHQYSNIFFEPSQYNNLVGFSRPQQYFQQTFGFESQPQVQPQQSQQSPFSAAPQLIPSQPGLQQPTPPTQPQQPEPRAQGCGTLPAGCPKTVYRSYDGSCNNLQSPIWGTPQTPYVRLLPPNYADGISTPTAATSGKPLPAARTVSLLLYPDVPIADPKFTLAVMQYGQIVTHDMSMIAGSTQSTPPQTQCCSSTGQLLPLADSPEHCFPIVLPDDDPAYGNSNVKCMNFLRTITTRDRGCVRGTTPAEQLTVVNHYLDLSIVYGNSDQVAGQLRQFAGGRLRTEQRQGQQWPPQANNVTGACSVQSAQEPCYMAGDTRVNQNPQLTAVQVILLREHNRIADVLAHLNPHWNDETLYQESRRINVAQHQHITYYEWLPILLGIANSAQNKIIYSTKNYVDDYDPNVNPTIINEHATSAFRFFHSQIAGHLDLVKDHRNSYGNLRLSDWFNRPAILEQSENFDDLTRGMATQPEMQANQFCDSEITQFLFRGNNQFGTDLKAFDVQRNRDHGLASYNDFRQFCGLPRAHHFEDFLDFISEENVKKLAVLYETPDDVDLTVGSSLEELVPGTLNGPVNLCILTEQFYRTRVGDRFFYENGHTKSAFTLEQLNEIRKASISRLFCDNGHHITSMQPRGFERISHDNQIVSCDSLQVVDLSLWKDFNQVPGEVEYSNPEYYFQK